MEAFTVHICREKRCFVSCSNDFRRTQRYQTIVIQLCMYDILNVLSLNRNINGRYFIKRKGSAERGMTMIIDIILP